MKTILIIINKKGEQRIEVNGVVGKACDVLAKPFEDAAGGKVLERTEKAEYHQTTDAQQQIGGG